MAKPLTEFLSVEQAWERLSGNVPAVRPSVLSRATQESLGYVLARAAVAKIDAPPADTSAMDGFAICAAGVKKGTTLTVSQRIAAGDVATPLAPATAARIFTGAQLPVGADCVMIQENCVFDTGQVTLNSDILEGDNVRKRGEDFTSGTVLLDAGHTLRPQDLGLLITAGVAMIDVYAPLRVGVIATGDELLDVRESLRSGTIFESNSPMIGAWLTHMGCVATRYLAADSHAATVKVLQEAVAHNDVVLTIGGVSVGEEDHVRAALAELGQTAFWKIKVRPGKPFLFGSINQTPVLGLPGNPVSSFVTFGLFCRPYLQACRGAGFQVTQTWPAIASFTTSQTSDRDNYLRGQLQRIDGQMQVQPMSRQGSGVQSALCRADVLILVPADQLIEKGQSVEVMLLSEFVG